MNIWAIVPIKPLNRAKSRLATILTPEQRKQLALKMLIHNLEILMDAPSMAGVLVISRDPEALAEARSIRGVQTLQESGTPELNNALYRASRTLESWGPRGVLILPADIPLVTIDDIEHIIQYGQNPYSLVIAPDRHRDGTNAIYTCPPNLISFGFGAGSFDRHLRAAEAINASIHIYESERLALDVDTPEDLKIYQDTSVHLDRPILDIMSLLSKTQTQTLMA